uniref:Uncharacterized protein n=1 Tax=Acrobeloides nanus TaxID=290746 RepID=A0A914CP02_9BILA
MLASIVFLTVVVDYAFSENATVDTVLEKVKSASDPMAQACTTPNNQAGMVIVDWELEDSHAQYPSHYCNCSKGTKYSWPSALNSGYYSSRPMDIYSNSYLAQSIDTDGAGKFCTNFCFCSTNGTCYTPTNKNSFNVDFIPYCQNSSCDVYAAIYGNSFTSETGQIIQENYLQSLYSANNSYIKVASFGCSGCADLKSITCDGPSHGPPTNCGDDEIFTSGYSSGSEAKCDNPSSINYWSIHPPKNYYERSSAVTFTTKGLPTTKGLSMTTKVFPTTTKLPTTTRGLPMTTERSYPMQWPMKARCICKPGLLRNTDGKCVNATGCQPSNITCEANQIWDPCGFEKTDLCNPYPTYEYEYNRNGYNGHSNGHYNGHSSGDHSGDSSGDHSGDSSGDDNGHSSTNGYGNGFNPSSYNGHLLNQNEYYDASDDFPTTPPCDQVNCPNGYGCVMKQLVTSTSTSVPICIKMP